jgi:hypothetical protein
MSPTLLSARIKRPPLTLEYKQAKKAKNVFITLKNNKTVRQCPGFDYQDVKIAAP